MSDVATFVAVAAIGGVLIWLTFKMEPHWASRDGRRSILRGQRVDHHGHGSDRWREYRIEVLDDGTVRARPRALLDRSGARNWQVISRTEQPGNKVVFVTRSAEGTGEMLLLRLPRSSRAVDVLDGVAVGS